MNLLTITRTSPNSAGLTPLEQHAQQILADRTERYRADLAELLQKCRKRGYVAEAKVVADDMGKLSSQSPVAANSGDFADLFRMRSRYNRDVNLVLAHLPKFRSGQREPAPDSALFFSGLMAWLTSACRRANAVASSGSKSLVMR